MSEELLDYNKLVEQGLRSVVRQALVEVAENGLPGEHHFYITFRTQHPNVDIAEYLREEYPEEMTIVLQYQYSGLDIDEEKFSVSLSFRGIQQKLVIPFEAITTFADPSVNFALQFQILSDEDLGEMEDEDGYFEEDSDEDSYDEKPKSETPPSGGAEIVTLDSFRKK